MECPTDVTDLQAVEVMVKKIESAYGPLDLLVNNAGSFYAIGPVWEVDAEKWWTDVSINILGVFNCCHVVTRGMIERGKGRIINLIGGGTGNPFPYGSAYGSSKAAVMRFTESLAAELKGTGVSAFALGPGLVRTVLTVYQLESETGQKYFPQIGKMFETGMDVPPTKAAEIVVALGTGCFDALSGRSFQAGDDLRKLEGRIPEILKTDQRTLRLL